MSPEKIFFATADKRQEKVTATLLHIFSVCVEYTVIIVLPEILSTRRFVKREYSGVQLMMESHMQRRQQSSRHPFLRI